MDNNKRYTLNLPEDLFNQVQQIANENRTTVVEILRKFIKLGLLAVHTERDKSTKLILKDKDGERELMILL